MALLSCSGQDSHGGTFLHRFGALAVKASVESLTTLSLSVTTVGNGVLLLYLLYQVSILSRLSYCGLHVLYGRPVSNADDCYHYHSDE
jgi:hypothetical protein